MKKNPDISSTDFVAGLFGVSTETVQKYLRTGLLTGRKVNGKWVIDPASIQKLADLRGLKFKWEPTHPPVSQSPKVETTDVVFVLDGSGSMNHLNRHVRNFVSDQIEVLRNSAQKDGLRYRVSAYSFSTHIRLSQPPLDLSQIDRLAVEKMYSPENAGTALNDALLTVAKESGSNPTLIILVTDGEENGSTCREIQKVQQAVISLLSGGKVSLTVAGPHGVRLYTDSVGIPPGNVTIWEATERGIQQLSRFSCSSLNTYTQARSMGITATQSFYAQPITKDEDEFNKVLKGAAGRVNPIKPTHVLRIGNNDPKKIRDFVNQKLGSTGGKCFYELTKPEKVQPYKDVVIQDTVTGEFFQGRGNLANLGIKDPKVEVRIRPGKLGNFKVFVQSTSVNRALQPNTALLVL